MEAFLFYCFSAIAIVSALFVIFVPRPSRALLCLIITMFALAVLFTLLGAYFVAMAHLIVYAGAVLVLFLFVIMLQGVGAEDVPFPKRFSPLLISLMCAAGVIFLGTLLINFRGLPYLPMHKVDGNADVIGRLLFNQYVLPFELTSVLLLLGVFAAVALAKKEDA